MIALFSATLFYVFLKATQQLNVMKGLYLHVVPVSFGMAACEVTIILLVVKAATWWAIIPMGIAGAIGSCAAMWTHRRYGGGTT